MKSATKILALCVIAFGFTGFAAMAEPQDVVVGPAKQPIRSEKFGTCVQTKWNATTDVCAPAAAPAPVPHYVEVPPAPQPVTKLAREDLTIYFLFNKDTLTPGAKSKLSQIVNAVNQSSKVTKVNIVGYTDEIGSNTYNDELSKRRALVVKNYLDTKMRIPANVLGLRGLGKEDPVVNCKSAKGRQQKIDCMAKDRCTEIEFEFQQ